MVWCFSTRRLLPALGAAALVTSLVSSATGADSAPAKLGITKPGVQIAMTRLKADQEYSMAPAWMLAADNLLMPDASGNALARIDSKNGKALDPLTEFSKPCAGAISAFGSMWVMDCGSGKIVRYNAKPKKDEEAIQATLEVGVDPVVGAIAATSDSIWALTDQKTTLSRIDPQTNHVVGEIRVPAACKGLTFGETALWILCPAQERILRINPTTFLVDESIKVSPEPQSMAIGGGSIWVLGGKEGKVERIDPKTNKVTETIALEVPGIKGDLAFGEGALWVTMTGFPLTRIDTESNQAVQQFKGEGGGAVFATSGSVWLSNLKEGTLWKLDPRRIQATLAE